MLLDRIIKSLTSGGTTTPRELAMALGCSEALVADALTRLIEFGHLERVEVARANGKTCGRCANCPGSARAVGAFLNLTGKGIRYQQKL